MRMGGAKRSQITAVARLWRQQARAKFALEGPATPRMAVVTMSEFTRSIPRKARRNTSAVSTA